MQGPYYAYPDRTAVLNVTIYASSGETLYTSTLSVVAGSYYLVKPSGSAVDLSSQGLTITNRGQGIYTFTIPANALSGAVSDNETTLVIKPSGVLPTTCLIKVPDDVELTNARYAGPRGPGVYYSSTGVTTSVYGIDGTVDNPVTSWTAVSALTARMAFKRVYVMPGATLNPTGTVSAFEIVGLGAHQTAEVQFATIAAQTTTNTVLDNLKVAGRTLGAIDVHDCLIDDMEVSNATLRNCGLTSTTTALTVSAAGSAVLDKCYSTVAGSGRPKIELDAAAANGATLSMRHYSGGIELGEIGAGNAVTIEGNGSLLLGTTVNNASIQLRGWFSKTDNGTGNTIVEAKDIAADVWAYSNYGNTLAGVGLAVSNLNDISAADVWNYNSYGTTLGGISTTVGTINTAVGALNDISAADVWNYNSYGTTLSGIDTAVGALNDISAADVWAYNTYGTTLSGIDTAVGALNDISAADVWSYNSYGITLSGINATVGTINTAVGALNDISAADVWNYNSYGTTLSGIDTTVGTINTTVASINSTVATINSNTSSLNDISAADVWDYLVPATPTAGSYGEHVDDLAANVWEVAVPATPTAGSYGAYVDDILEDTGTTLSSAIATVDTVVDGIVVDVAAVQTDVTTIISNIASLNDIAASDVWAVTVSTPTAGTFGAYVDEIQTDVNDILVDTGTTLPNTLATITSDIAAVQGDVTQIIADIASLSIPTVASIVAGVWQESPTGYVTSGQMGYLLNSYLNHSIANIDADVAALNDIAAADVWAVVVGTPTAGTYGAYVDEVQTDVRDILVDTGTTLPSTLTTINSNVLTVDTVVDGIVLDVGAVQTDVTQIIADIAALAIPTVAQIADGVWQEPHAGYTTSGQMGYLMDSYLNHSILNVDQDIAALNNITAGDVWDYIIPATPVAGSYGEHVDSLGAGGGSAPTVAQIVAGVWQESPTGYTTSGQMGYLMNSYLDHSILNVDQDVAALNDIAASDVWNVLVTTPLANTYGRYVSDILGDTANIPADLTAITNDIAAVQGDVTQIISDIGGLVIPTVTQIVDGVWQEPHTKYTTAGQMGYLMDQNLDDSVADLAVDVANLNNIAAADVWSVLVGIPAGNTYGRYVSDILGDTGTTIPGTLSTISGDIAAVQGDVTQIISDIGGLAIPTVAQIADGVWQEPHAGYVTPGQMGYLMDQYLDDSVADLAVDVANLNNIAASDVWAVPVGTPTATTYGGYVADILGDTGTTIPNTLSGITTDIATVDTVVDGIVLDIAALQGDVTQIIADIGNLVIPTAAAIALRVWQEPHAGYVTAGQMGYLMDQYLDDSVADLAQDVANLVLITAADVWTYNGYGTTLAGIPSSIAALNDISVADIWGEPIGNYQGTGNGDFGEIISDNIDLPLTTLQQDVQAISCPAASVIALAVWQYSTSTFLSNAQPGTFGTWLADLNDFDAATDCVDLCQTSVDAVADQVWNEILAGHTISGSAGAILAALQGGGAPVDLSEIKALLVLILAGASD
jgi:hypothetical protein